MRHRKSGGARSMTAEAISRLHWNSPPANCVLSDEEVHVWIADLEQYSNSPVLAKILSSDERERAARFRFKRDRENFVAARGVLRLILSRYTKKMPSQIEFGYEANGKPFLTDSPKFDHLNFNLSHCGATAIYAMTKAREIGIDLEHEHSFCDVDAVAARIFSSEEQECLSFLQSPKKEKRFFQYWTRKEAQLKCSGKGLSASDVQKDFDGTILELRPAEDYVASLAVRGEPFTLQTWQWSQD